MTKVTEEDMKDMLNKLENKDSEDTEGTEGAEQSMEPAMEPEPMQGQPNEYLNRIQKSVMDEFLNKMK
jgi:hypothetical protein